MSELSLTLRERVTGRVRAARLAPMVRQIVGRVSRALGADFWMARLGRAAGLDRKRADYAFWDKLRRGLQKGYTFGGLFAKPLTEIVASYVLGGGVGFVLAQRPGADPETDDVAYTNGRLAAFARRHRALFLSLVEDLYALGDQFVAVNADGSLTVLAPDSVTVRVHPLDYRRPVAYTVHVDLDEVSVTDEYRLDGRTLKLRWKKAVDGHYAGEVETFQYANLIGRLPIVHLPNDRSTNELFGRPIYEAMLDLFYRYDVLLRKGLDGAEIHGNPMPVVEGAEDPEAVKEANGEEVEYYDAASGTYQTVFEIIWHRLSMLILGKGATFKFASPQVGFSEDIRSMLKLLFLLLLDHSRIPEFLWGGAIASSKASAEVQLPPFLSFVEGRRTKIEGVGEDGLGGAQGGLLELADVWLRTVRLTDPRVVVGQVAAAWPALGEADEQMRFRWVEFLRGLGLLTNETTLRLALGDVIDDPKAELAQAQRDAMLSLLDNDDFVALLAQALNDAQARDAEDAEAAA